MPDKQLPNYRILHALGDTLLAFILMLMLVTIAMSIGQEGQEGQDFNLLTNLATTTAAFGIVLVLRRRYWQPRRFIGSGKINIQLLLPLALCAFALSIVLSEIDNMLYPFFQNSQYHRAMFNILTNEHPLIVILGIGLIAPLVEELFFRAYLAGRLAGNCGPMAVIIASSLLFAIFHVNPSQMIAAFFSGLILGYLYLSSGSLLPALLFHSLFNTLPLLLLYSGIVIRGYTELETIGRQPWWFTLGAFLLLAGCLPVLIKMLPALPGAPQKPEPPAKSSDEEEGAK